LQINHDKFADLRFADWRTSEVCGFAIADWPKNLPIYDLRTNKKYLRAHLCWQGTSPPVRLTEYLSAYLSAYKNMAVYFLSKSLCNYNLPVSLPVNMPGQRVLNVL
jgi:hypothetical protein